MVDSGSRYRESLAKARSADGDSGQDACAESEGRDANQPKVANSVRYGLLRESVVPLPWNQEEQGGTADQYPSEYGEWKFEGQPRRFNNEREASQHAQQQFKVVRARGRCEPQQET